MSNTLPEGSFLRMYVCDAGATGRRPAAEAEGAMTQAVWHLYEQECTAHEGQLFTPHTELILRKRIVRFLETSARLR